MHFKLAVRIMQNPQECGYKENNLYKNFAEVHVTVMLLFTDGIVDGKANATYSYSNFDRDSV